MKLKKLAVALAVSTIITVSALPFAACANSGKFGSFGTTTINLADYAVEHNLTQNSVDGYITAKSVLSADRGNVVIDNSGLLVVKDSSDRYKVYNIAEEKSVLSALAVQPEFVTLDGVLPVIKCASSKTSDEVAYYTYDGAQILEYGDYSSITCSIKDYYVKGENAKSTVYIVSAQKSYVIQYVYLRAVTDKETQTVTYKKVNENDISLSAPAHLVGGDLSGLYHDFYSYDAEKPVEGEITEYQYGILGNNVSFYHNGEKSGEINMLNSKELALMGNYFYYYTLLPVSSLAKKGYNYVVLQDGFSSTVEFKYKYQLYRYDITKNKTKKINLDAVILKIVDLYNYTAKSYDAGVVYGYQMIDGVAYSDADEFCYLTDKNLKAVFDCTLLGISNMTIYNLGNDKFLVGKYIVDANFNVLNKNVAASAFYYNEKLFSFISNGYYGFMDLNGQVVVEPKYYAPNGSIKFYGGAAYVYEKQIDGTDKEVFLYADGTTKPVPQSDENSTVTIGAGYVMTETKKEYGHVTYECSSFNGHLIFYQFCRNDDIVNPNGEYISMRNINGVPCIEYVHDKKVDYYKVV
ncbi:MAG: hypothetical protein HDP34_04015 [Clostridia bacterium]|nr:hypothetical protein [Clostridia bacterium]